MFMFCLQTEYHTLFPSGSLVMAIKPELSQSLFCCFILSKCSLRKAAYFPMTHYHIKIQDPT